MPINDTPESNPDTITTLYSNADAVLLVEMAMQTGTAGIQQTAAAPAQPDINATAASGTAVQRRRDIPE